ncbi:MAG: hypothetical protein JW969_00870 [Spirochaetales bacterium]|nr:hypothetical protein [Spirochaetales bacterium]
MISSIKIISSRENADGIDICSSNIVQIDNCFIRSWDDGIVIKGYDGINTENVTATDCILWTDLAQSLEIGFETRCPRIRNIQFRNITILHNFHKPVMSIHIGDTALVENVIYENIIVEDSQMGLGDGWNYLIDLWIGRAEWTENRVDGSIRNIRYKNIDVLGGKKPGIRIFGLGKGNRVEDITIDNLTILGEKIQSLKQLTSTVNEFTSNISFTDTP